MLWTIVGEEPDVESAPLLAERISRPVRIRNFENDRGHTRERAIAHRVRKVTCSNSKKNSADDVVQGKTNLPCDQDELKPPRAEHGVTAAQVHGALGGGHGGRRPVDWWSAGRGQFRPGYTALQRPRGVAIQPLSDHHC